MRSEDEEFGFSILDVDRDLSRIVHIHERIEGEPESPICSSVEGGRWWATREHGRTLDQAHRLEIGAATIRSDNA